MKNKSWFSMLKNADGKSAMISIYSEIGGWGIRAVDFRNELKSLGDVGSIELRINSPGGDVIDGFAIYNMLMEHPARIIAKIDGWAASMASIIAMAADEIHMPSNTWLMIHNPWSVAMGDKGELRKMADIMEKMEGHAILAYQQHTTLSDAEISNLMDAETWMDGKEAVAKGFAEVLMDELEIAASVNAGKLNAPVAAMAWAMAAKSEVTPSTSETEKPDESTGGTDNAVQTTENTDKPEETEKPTEDAKPADAAAGAIHTGGVLAPASEVTAVTAAAPGISPELMAKIDAAYDEGEAVGYDKAMKELGAKMKQEAAQMSDQLREKESAIVQLETENASSKQAIKEYQARLSKLSGGLSASVDAENAVPGSWETALEKHGYADARKKFPQLFSDYRARQKSQRK